MDWNHGGSRANTQSGGENRTYRSAVGMVRCLRFDRSADFEDPMSRIFQFATASAVGLTALAAVAMTVPGLAQENVSVVPGDVVFEAAPQGDQPSAIADPNAATPGIVHDSLADMVAAMPWSEPEDATLRCIATGVYFESGAEPLEGQLAVAHVILARAASGRFAPTPCEVLTQRGQFSFVRRGVVPTPPENRTWRNAVAIARIAQAEQWRNPAPGAMFFHATYVSPGWNRPRVARLGNHIFYR